MDFKTFFDYQLANSYAERIYEIDNRFDQSVFKLALGDQLLSLEMKDRVRAIADSLWFGLSLPYQEAIVIIMNATQSLDLRGFPVWIASQIVEKYGVDDFEKSMATIHQITQLFTGEFAIRPFLTRYPEQTFKQLNQWVDDDSVDVRRLVSEGSRPRLPWASRVPLLLVDPDPILHLLDQLKIDSAEYVRRSVANNINDISKDSPEKIIEMVTKWMKTLPQTKELSWVIRHGLRSLLKNSNPAALTLMGYDKNVAVDVNHFFVTQKCIQIGDSVQLNCQLSNFNEIPAKLMIDFILLSPGANGKKNRKVFKWSKRNLVKPGAIKLHKKLNLKPNRVRNVYPGEHEIHLIINGENKAVSVFNVVEFR